MNFLKTPYLAVLITALTLVGAVSVRAQNQSTALERGYRTGYSDGYTAGFRDGGDKAARDFKNKEDYQRADRTFNDVWGPIEDYRDGYQQGFEAGYNGGYDRRDFDSTIPTGLSRRPLPAARNNSDGGVTPEPGDTPVGNPTINPTPNGTVVQNGSFSIPRNTLLAVELLAPLSTDVSQRGDPFQARIAEPTEFAGAILEGRVVEVKRPGKVKGVAQLQLRFERIRYADNRTAEFHADLIEIVPTGNNEGATVDSEGGVKGQDSTKDDVSKVGAASGIGAIIGAIAGGGHGAVIGAVIGGGAATAGTMTRRGKDIRLDRGQVLKIKTSTDTGVL